MRSIVVWLIGILLLPGWMGHLNVENGFGIVAGYQEDKLRITMRRDTVPPSWNPWDGYSVQ